MKQLKKHLLLSYETIKVHFSIIFERPHSQVKTILKRNNAKAAHFKQPLSWQTFKSQTAIAARAKHHDNYEFLISQFDSELILLGTKLTSKSKTFFGSGLGQDTLNSYRKISINNTTLFEKIYLTNSRDFNHFSWASKNIIANTNTIGIKTPKVVAIQQGCLLSAVYFEYIDEKLDNYLSFIKPAIKISKLLQQIKPIEINRTIQNYRSDPHFKKCYQTTFELIKKFEKPEQLELFLKLDKKVEQSIKVVTHGDLHGKNIGKHNWVIDWDRAGYYPIGYDIALSISKSFKLGGKQHLDHLFQTLLTEQLSDLDNLENIRNITFFTLVFYSHRIYEKITLNRWLNLSRSILHF